MSEEEKVKSSPLKEEQIKLDKDQSKDDENSSNKEKSWFSTLNYYTVAITDKSKQALSRLSSEASEFYEGLKKETGDFVEETKVFAHSMHSNINSYIGYDNDRIVFNEEFIIKEHQKESDWIEFIQSEKSQVKFEHEQSSAILSHNSHLLKLYEKFVILGNLNHDTFWTIWMYSKFLEERRIQKKKEEEQKQEKKQKEQERVKEISTNSPKPIMTENNQNEVVSKKDYQEGWDDWE